MSRKMTSGGRQEVLDSTVLSTFYGPMKMITILRKNDDDEAEEDNDEDAEEDDDEEWL
jgi:hypothetical protein